MSDFLGVGCTYCEGLGGRQGCPFHSDFASTVPTQPKWLEPHAPITPFVFVLPDRQLLAIMATQLMSGSMARHGSLTMSVEDSVETALTLFRASQRRLAAEESA